MKKSIFAAFAVIFSACVSNGATIVTNEVFLTIADGSGGTPALAENITAPSRAWYRDDLWWRSDLDFGYQGLGGGRVTIQTEPGETVTSVEIYLSVGPIPGFAPWTFAFQSYGSDQQTQIWVSQNSLNGTRAGLGWLPLNFQPDRRAPIYFEVQTTLGSVGNQYYAVSTVPEPSAGILTVLSSAAVLSRRKRPKG